MIPGKRINYFKEGFYLGASNKYGYLGPPYPPARKNNMIIQYKNYVMDFDPDILVFIIHEKDFLFADEVFIPSPVLKMQDDSLIIDYSFYNNRTCRIYRKISFIMENSCVVKALNNLVKMSKRDACMQILFDKFYHPKAEVEKKVVLDTHILKSLEWLKGKQVFFVFKEGLPQEIVHEFDPYGVISTSVEP
jgi:hypothetical protein